MLSIAAGGLTDPPMNSNFNYSQIHEVVRLLAFRQLQEQDKVNTQPQNSYKHQSQFSVHVEPREGYEKHNFSSWRG